MKNIEVIAINEDDIKIINKTKAARIELVWNLEVGGLSPMIQTITEALKLTNIPIHVMVRPQYKSFVYSENQFIEIIVYIKKILKLDKKPKGIVFGSLTEDNKINEEQLRKVIAIKEDLELTFHRAFDMTPNYKESLEILKKYKVDTLLSSGTKSKAEEGIKELTYINNNKGKINLLIGSGINLENSKKIINKIGGNNLHIGTAVRLDRSLEKNIDAELVDKIFKNIN